MEHKKDFIYIQMENHLLKLIKSNLSNPQYKLPSENQLALFFNASRISAKKAMDALQNAGYIIRQHGRGTFISPNASTLFNAKADTICLFIPNFDSNFMRSLISNTVKILHNQGYSTYICPTLNSPEMETFYINNTLNADAKGYIIFPVNNKINTTLLKLALNNCPIVFIDRFIEGIDLLSVTSNNYQASYDATKLLIENGHKNIGFITAETSMATSVKERYAGYERCMLDHKIMVSNEQILQLKDQSSCTAKLLEYFNKNKDLTALIAPSAGFIHLLYNVLNSLHLSVPNDISLILFDNEQTEMLPFKPYLIEQQTDLIAQTAVSKLIESIDHTPKPEHIQIPVKILKGNSIKNLSGEF